MARANANLRGLNSRRDRDNTRGRRSIRPKRTTVVGPTTVGTSRDIAERFATFFANYEPSQIAQGAECTKEAARLWLNAERTISLESALKLARNTREGRYWLASELGEFDSPEMIARLLSSIDRD